VTRVGVKPVLVVGVTMLTAGLLFFTQVSVGGGYVGDLLPGFLIIGVGIGFSFVPISISALAGVKASEAGLASGLINTSQQIGGALGIAALSTIARSRTEDSLATATMLPEALVDGFSSAFLVGAIFAVLGLVASLTLIRRDELEPQTLPAREKERAGCGMRPLFTTKRPRDDGGTIGGDRHGPVLDAARSGDDRNRGSRATPHGCRSSGGAACR
jgi:MFS family permease